MVTINEHTIPNDERLHLYFMIYLSTGTGYGATEEEAGRPSRQVVRVKSRREEDSPSPEDTTPVHARP